MVRPSMGDRSRGEGWLALSPQRAPVGARVDSLSLAPPPSERPGFFLPRPAGERVPAGRVRGLPYASA